MTPAEIVAAITAKLAVKFPALTVESHGGRFTERELAMTLAKAPALLLGCLGLGPPQPVGEWGWRCDLRLVAYVLGSDTVSTARDIAALDAVFALHAWLPDQRWGLADAQIIDPQTITSDNLYTGHSNLLRVSVWAVAWTQAFTLELP